MAGPGEIDPLRDSPFSIEVEQRPGAAVVRLTGSCTMNVAGQIGERLVQIASDAVPLIVLDLSRLDFIESTGLGGIVAGYLRSRRHNGEIRLAAAQPAIRQLLELTRLTQLFRLYESLPAALAGRPPTP
jgi:anti-sigma B factor antagonist